jgi:hypothetical protein
MHVFFLQLTFKEVLQNTGCFIKIWPISFICSSGATLDVVINQVSYVIGSFRFSGKAVVLLPIADWHYIRELNRMATYQEKMQCCFWYDATKSWWQHRCDIEQDLERTYLLRTQLQSGIESLQRMVASARRVGWASHEVVAWMWNEFEKLLRAAYESPFT